MFRTNSIFLTPQFCPSCLVCCMLWKYFQEKGLFLGLNYILFDYFMVLYLMWCHNCWWVFCDRTLQSDYLHFSTGIEWTNTWCMWHNICQSLYFHEWWLLWAFKYPLSSTFVVIYSLTAWSTFCFIWRQWQDQTLTATPALGRVVESMLSFFFFSSALIELRKLLRQSEVFHLHSLG